MLSEKGQRQDPLCFCPGLQKDMKEHEKAGDMKVRKDTEEWAGECSWFTVADRSSEEIRKGEEQEDREGTNERTERWDTTPDSVVTAIM